MGFSVGNCRFSHSPLTVAPPPSFLPRRRKMGCKKATTATASLHLENMDDSRISRRRVFLVLGFSAFPFLQFRADAVDDKGKDKENVKMATPQGADRSLQEASNPFVALLNGIGIIGLGVIGALYALGRQEKREMETTIESLKTTMKDKEATMAMLRKEFEKKLANEQEEKLKQIKEVEKLAFISNQLSLAGEQIARLQRELQTEKGLATQLEVKVDQLQSDLVQAAEDKKSLETQVDEKENLIESLRERISLLSLEMKDKETDMRLLSSSLAEMETEYKNLTSVLNQTKAELVETNSKLKGLTEEALKTRGQLEIQETLVVDLNEKIRALTSEEDDLRHSYVVLEEAYNSLKQSSTEKADSDMKLLSEKEHQLNQLQERLDVAVGEGKRFSALVGGMEKEQDSLKTLLEKEIINVKSLKNELHIAQQALGESKSEVSDLQKQLKESKKSIEMLGSEISKIRAEFAHSEKTLLERLHEANSRLSQVTDELVLAKEVLDKTKDELIVSSENLRTETEAHATLQKELSEAYTKAESLAEHLKVERMAVASSQRELDALEKQIAEDKEVRKSLETDLEEAANSLDEMNKRIVSLSAELDIVNSRASNLEDEKNYLYKSLIDQKEASKVAEENLEDAQKISARLGREREFLDKKAKKLEEGLASAKGEILRLRRQMNTTEISVNEHDQQNNSKPDEIAVVAKKTTRRRKKTTS